MKKTPKSFNTWWSGIRSHPKNKRKQLTDRWLYYATKTVSMRGNHDEQLVVFVIWNRYSKSKYCLPKTQAKTVYDIINQKQLAYKRENKKSTSPVIVKKRTSRRIISSGYGNQRINYNR